MGNAAEQLEPGAQMGAGFGPVDTIVPRISVEAFCTTAEFASAMQEAIKDRRMAKALCSVTMGGVERAAKRFTHTGTPNVLIVESQEGGFAMFGELEQLAQVCDVDTRVIVVGPSNDVTIYRELIRQGVSEYLVTPCSAMQVIEAIATLYSDPATAPAAKTIAVYGAKGGVGASILAHNIAWAISADVAKETILIDLDMEFGTAALDFNIETKHSLADALVDIEGLDEVKLARLLYAQNDKLRLLPAPASMGTAVVVDEEEVTALIEALRHSTDVIVLDVPHMWTPGTRAALQAADEIVLVATPDLASLRNVKTIYDYLQAERSNDAAPRVVLNQTGVQKRPEIPASDFSEILGAEIDLEIPYDGALFGSAINNGQMLSEVSGTHKGIDQLHKFAGTLLGLKSEKAGKVALPAVKGLSLKGLLGGVGKGAGKNAGGSK